MMSYECFYVILFLVPRSAGCYLQSGNKGTHAQGGSATCQRSEDNLVTCRLSLCSATPGVMLFVGASEPGRVLGSHS